MSTPVYELSKPSLSSNDGSSEALDLLECRRRHDNKPIRVGGMKQLSEFERGRIVGARMAGASVTRTAELLNVSRGTVSKVLTAYAKYGQTASAKSNCGRKSKLSDTERQTLIRIVTEKHTKSTSRKTTTFEIASELNQNRCDPVSTRTVRRELGKVLERLKEGLCGDLGNIPLHALDKTLVLENMENRPEEEEEEELFDEEMNIQRVYEDEASVREESESQEDTKSRDFMKDGRFYSKNK